MQLEKVPEYTRWIAFFADVPAKQGKQTGLTQDSAYLQRISAFTKQVLMCILQEKNVNAVYLKNQFEKFEFDENLSSSLSHLEEVSEEFEKLRSISKELESLYQLFLSEGDKLRIDKDYILEKPANFGTGEMRVLLWRFYFEKPLGAELAKFLNGLKNLPSELIEAPKTKVDFDKLQVLETLNLLLKKSFPSFENHLLKDVINRLTGFNSFCDMLEKEVDLIKKKNLEILRGRVLPELYESITLLTERIKSSSEIAIFLVSKGIKVKLDDLKSRVKKLEETLKDFEFQKMILNEINENTPLLSLSEISPALKKIADKLLKKPEEIIIK